MFYLPIKSTSLSFLSLFSRSAPLNIIEPYTKKSYTKRGNGLGEQYIHEEKTKMPQSPIYNEQNFYSERLTLHLSNLVLR